MHGDQSARCGNVELEPALGGHHRQSQTGGMSVQVMVEEGSLANYEVKALKGQYGDGSETQILEDCGQQNRQNISCK